MTEVLQNVEDSIREVSKMAGQTLGLLNIREAVGSPTRYLTVMHSLEKLSRLWKRHAGLQREIYPLIVHYDSHFADCLSRMDARLDDVQEKLDVFATIGWPRSPALGLTAVRGNAIDVVALVLRQLERERLTVVPLLKRWVAAAAAERESVRIPEAVTTSAASA